MFWRKRDFLGSFSRQAPEIFRDYFATYGCCHSCLLITTIDFEVLLKSSNIIKDTNVKKMLYEIQYLFVPNTELQRTNTRNNKIHKQQSTKNMEFQADIDKEKERIGNQRIRYLKFYQQTDGPSKFLTGCSLVQGIMRVPLIRVA